MDPRVKSENLKALVFMLLVLQSDTSILNKEKQTKTFLSVLALFDISVQLKRQAKAWH